MVALLGSGAEPGARSSPLQRHRRRWQRRGTFTSLAARLCRPPFFNRPVISWSTCSAAAAASHRSVCCAPSALDSQATTLSTFQPCSSCALEPAITLRFAPSHLPGSRSPACCYMLIRPPPPRHQVVRAASLQRRQLRPRHRPGADALRPRARRRSLQAHHLHPREDDGRAAHHLRHQHRDERGGVLRDWAPGEVRAVLLLRCGIRALGWLCCGGVGARSVDGGACGCFLLRLRWSIFWLIYQETLMARGCPPLRCDVTGHCSCHAPGPLLCTTSFAPLPPFR